MRANTILARLLLCLALVINGASAVHASVRMVFDGVANSAAADIEAQQSCHDGMAMAPDAVDDPGHPAPATSPDDGCCPASGCLCSCVWSSPTLPVHSVQLTPLRAAPPASVAPVVHASPTLPHLIRPPIG